ncbi:IS1380 family transposase [Actinomadura sp. LD22]|uniref:IS1380 family transposase n=1 Tax=Actinomadura physcomitrii TaxID=2650748 RepID=A0A6I4M263_9ACTN|nr:IS1380 family transposase [Actinomadura physcomitrii]MVZ99179.1 IS1380 family transposase [Actinomadura physcomitrii]
MRLSHAAGKTHVVFDDERLISCAGLVPVMRLAERCGLPDLVSEHVRVADRCGANAAAKVSSIVAGMAAGADSIDDLDVLRHGGMTKVFDQIRAPSTLGSFLRCLRWGNVRQLEKAGRELLNGLAAHTPLLPGAGALAFLDVDSMQRRVYSARKQGAGFGHTKIQGKSVLIRGLNTLAATLCTPLAAPVITATRLRGGTASSARGADALVAEAIGTSRRCGATGLLVMRGDSAFYSAKVIAACRRNGARFSVTAKMDPKIKTAIAAIPADAWTAIRYPNAIFDEESGQWISDAEVAETTYTAFASKKTPVTARLIVRRVRRLNPTAPTGQDELFKVWRYHAVFTDSPFEMLQAETQHRDHTGAIEQTFADLTDGPLAHLPSGDFAANAARLTCAAITHNLLRAADCLASALHAKARGATLRRHLIDLPARLARHGRGHLTLHLPEHWPWAPAWRAVFDTVHPPPTAAA